MERPGLLRWVWYRLRGDPAGARRHGRVTPLPQEPVRVQIMGNDFLESLTAKDLSIGGIGIFVPHGFSGIDVRGDLTLIVTLPAERPMKVRGRMRHKSPVGGPGAKFVRAKNCIFGVQFVELAPETERALLRYIESRSR